ncbi:MAG TPA: (deoxy)nucleoside triphosphate pyrophosphohydrolase [Candidatus Acidoferrales bacterium]|nr:(deoxy)nucleoside triphosphate pyrophosphohydrolase [Candidatus Acidoferrales bacterium]
MVVVAAVIVREGRILVCQRSRKDSFPLKWEFPGGKVKSGETPTAALVRELREELGVGATIGAEVFRTRHKYAQMKDDVELIFYRANLEGAKVQNLVFEAIEWSEPAALPAKDFLEADKGLIERLANGDGTVPRG